MDRAVFIPAQHNPIPGPNRDFLALINVVGQFNESQFDPGFAIQE